MPRKLYLLAAAAIVAATVPVLAATADAVHLVCGQDVSGTVTLDADLSCPSTNGLRINADNTVIKLNGHTIDGADTGFTGIFNDFGFVKVKVLGPGTISNFQAAMFMVAADKTKVMGAINVSSNGTGIQIFGDKVQVKGTDVTASAGAGIRVSGAKALVEGNTVDGNDNGIVVSGDGAKVFGNIVTDSIVDGINVQGLAASVKGNTSSTNGEQGIEVDDVSAKVLSNTANDNTSFAILGPDGIKAKGNACDGNNGGGAQSDPAYACST